jgi:hypothetical protein
LLFHTAQIVSAVAEEMVLIIRAAKIAAMG